MKLEDMTLKQVKEYCNTHDCKRCEIDEICGGHCNPHDWNLEGEVHNGPEKDMGV